MRQYTKLWSELKSNRQILDQMIIMFSNQRIEDLQRKQQSLTYNDVETQLKQYSILSPSLELDKLKQEVNILRDIEYQLSLSIISCGISEKTKSNNKYQFDFSKFKNLFSNIKNETLPIVLSKDKVIDLEKIPHLLVAGQTGCGKSVFLNIVILSLLSKLSEQQCQLSLIDPKRVEFSIYQDEKHLYFPIASKLSDISFLLDKLVSEMETRYQKLETVFVKSLLKYNEISKEKMPYIVVVIDELADLMIVGSKEVETKIIRLAQMARAVGIHLVMATQRPVVEVVTGLIKANLPGRISFRVASKQDSRVILDESGAESLKEPGEFIFKHGNCLEKHKGIYLNEDQIKDARKIQL